MITFRRASNDHDELTEPGTYRRITVFWAKYHGKNGRKFWAEACCPGCHKVWLVGDNHDVSDDGTVSPSSVCAFPPCTFHEMIKLDNWSEPMNAEFKRWRGDVDSMPSGYYRKALTAHGFGSGICRCPICKRTFTVANHQISADGSCSPSMVCPHENCTFHPSACKLLDMTDPALPANDPPPPDNEVKQMLVHLDETGAATHVGCGGDVYVLTNNEKLVSCDKCKDVVGVEAVTVVPEPPEIEVKPSEETPQPFRDALARDTEETPAPLPEPTWRDPQCIDRHLSGCGCTGDARAPI